MSYNGKLKTIATWNCYMCAYLEGGQGVEHPPPPLENSNFNLTVNIVKLLTVGLRALPVEQKDQLSLASHPHSTITWTSLCESH